MEYLLPIAVISMVVYLIIKGKKKRDITDSNTGPHENTRPPKEKK